MQNSLLVFTAPPASGKTYLIKNLTRELKQVPLVICPLRALANECLSLWGANCIVMTPEEWLVKKVTTRIVILDEFHLFFYWGDSFRPKMWEAFYEMVASAELVIVLTATLTEEMIEVIKTYGCHFDKIVWANQGNQKLLYPPKKYYQAPSRRWMEEFILTQKWKGVSLIFCPYRKDVMAWEKKLKAAGYRVWSCVGGEAGIFSLKVQSERAPHFIVSTTVLSHGVNLPTISRIFFLYPVKNIDFWIQMVARGGRRGESYDVYALENPVGIKWSRTFNYLAILRIDMKMRLQQYTKQIQEWFLKA